MIGYWALSGFGEEWVWEVVCRALVLEAGNGLVVSCDCGRVG